MARRLCFLVLIVGLIAAPGAAQNDGRPECARYPAADLALPNGYPFDVVHAVALFRFHRQDEALRELDTARAIVRGPWRWRIPPDQREEVASELDGLRRCLASTPLPPLSTLTVRVIGYAADTDQRLRPQAGARIHVEGIPVGRTGRDGTLTVRVPSGPIEVDAGISINQWSFADVSLAPGESQLVEIRLSDDKEVNQGTSLVLAEATDDIVPLTAKSFTLKFVRDGRVAPVASIDHILAGEDRSGDLTAQLDKYFRIVNGEIVATNARQVFDALAPQFGHTINLEVQAMASEHELHQGRIAFRVGQSPLSIRLETPPSNGALPVSGIAVGISLLGAGIAVERVSDAQGRLTIDSFPHGTVSLECVAVSNGKYYYGQGTLVHSKAQSVALVLRHVDDVRNGVAPLVLEARNAEADFPVARTIEPPTARELNVRRILVSSAEKDRTVAMSTTFIAARGAECVMLAYDISTSERRRDPRFDDVWTLSLFAEDGQSLLHVIRNVSSQDQLFPNWQPGDRTGRIQEFFNISKQSSRGDVRLTLVGSATNIGDDRYPTTVEALITTADKAWCPTESPF